MHLNQCRGGCGRMLMYGSTCMYCAKNAVTPKAGNPLIDDDGGPVTRATVGDDHFTNDITANAAVHAKMSKAQYIRWLLDDRKKLIDHAVMLARMQPPAPIIVSNPPIVVADKAAVRQHILDKSDQIKQELPPAGEFLPGFGWND